MDNDFLKDLIEEMEKGVIPWEQGFSTSALRSYNPITKTRYQGKNVLRLLIFAKDRNYSDPRWLTFLQGTSLGYKLKKGAKGVRLYKYVRTVKKDDEENKESESTIKKISSGLVPFTVFNASEFEDFPKDENIYMHEENNAIFEYLISHSEAPITFDGLERNYYNPCTDSIHVTPPEYFKDINQWYATVAHEVAHSTGHKSRLARQGGRFGSPEYAYEELIAELSSALLNAEFNLSFDDTHKKNHCAYLQSWLKVLKNNEEKLANAFKDAQKAVEYIKDNMIDKSLLKETSPISPKQKEYTTSEVIDKVLDMQGVSLEKSGTWYWAIGNTREYKEQLKELSFKFSRKRSAWYYVAVV